MSASISIQKRKKKCVLSVFGLEVDQLMHKTDGIGKQVFFTIIIIILFIIRIIYLCFRVY